ncbi:MAG TPA: hypothetical protein VH186_23530 [Chloroflexia bacterium]|nr:hypothetical protein [Chloroflexia bacterium]
MARAKQTDDSARKLSTQRNLPALSGEQFEYALELVRTDTRQAVLEAALSVIQEVADPAGREVLVEKYNTLSAEGGKHDAGAYVRAALLRALKPVARVKDLPVLEKAAATYEFIPPGKTSEVGAGLRSAALVAMNEVDEVLAAYHCVRLLTDRYTSQMSGEPAVTAVRILAAQGQSLLLYSYVIRQEEAVAEVSGECLRNLTGLPPSLLDALVQRYRESQSEIVLVGLFDLLLSHPEGKTYRSFMLDFLNQTRFFNLYRYMVLALLGRREAEFIEELRRNARSEDSRVKLQILDELAPVK